MLGGLLVLDWEQEEWIAKQNSKWGKWGQASSQTGEGSVGIYKELPQGEKRMDR